MIIYDDLCRAPNWILWLKLAERPCAKYPWQAAGSPSPRMVVHLLWAHRCDTLCQTISKVRCILKIPISEPTKPPYPPLSCPTEFGINFWIWDGLDMAFSQWPRWPSAVSAMAWISHDFPHLFEDLFDAAVQFRFGIRRDRHLGSVMLRTMTSKLLAQGLSSNVAFCLYLLPPAEDDIYWC